MKKSEFSDLLLTWYELNKRELPWRDTKDPYKIWLSEIILQQTRVNQGLPYYNKFVREYPEVENLAMAREQEVLKNWQGLGYYSRARNLHHTAKTVTNDYNGNFPAEYDELIKLKGVGDYTASAISSIAFNKPHPAIDGNVIRVLARIFGVKKHFSTKKGKAQIKELALKYLDRDNPGNHNQALMEFGSGICVPANPECQSCFFKSNCYAYLNNMVKQLPVSAIRVQTRYRYFSYIVLYASRNGMPFTFMKKRSGNDIWKNLWDYPLIETRSNITAEELISSTNWSEMFGSAICTIRNISKEYTHKLSHRTLITRFYLVSVDKSPHYFRENFRKTELNAMLQVPVPKLIETYQQEFLIKYLKNNQH